MEDTIFFLLKIAIKTKHNRTKDAIEELQSKTEVYVSSTKNVKVLKTEIMQLNLKTL